MKLHLIISVLIMMFGCASPTEQMTTQELILSDLQEEYLGNAEQKKQISNAIANFQSDSKFEIATTQFQSIRTGAYKAILYVVEDGVIKSKIERLNNKYHAGTFELSNYLSGIENEVLYKILLPTSSVPQVVTLNEYLEVKSDGEITSLFSFNAEERDCAMGKEKGELIKRDIAFENGDYFLNKNTYEFNCEDFDFKNEIPILKLVSTEKEKLDVRELD